MALAHEARLAVSLISEPWVVCHDLSVPLGDLAKGRLREAALPDDFVQVCVEATPKPKPKPNPVGDEHSPKIYFPSALFPLDVSQIANHLSLRHSLHAIVLHVSMEDACLALGYERRPGWTRMRCPPRI